MSRYSPLSGGQGERKPFNRKKLKYPQLHKIRDREIVDNSKVHEPVLCSASSGVLVTNLYIYSAYLLQFMTMSLLCQALVRGTCDLCVP